MGMAKTQILFNTVSYDCQGWGKGAVSLVFKKKNVPSGARKAGETVGVLVDYNNCNFSLSYRFCF